MFDFGDFGQGAQRNHQCGRARPDSSANEERSDREDKQRDYAESSH
jgi:hypothetical protein